MGTVKSDSQGNDECVIGGKIAVTPLNPEWGCECELLGGITGCKRLTIPEHRALSVTNDSFKTKMSRLVFKTAQDNELGTSGVSPHLWSPQGLARKQDRRIW